MRFYHGKKNTRLYRIWKVMKGRCYNKNHIKYPNYGARGIKVCDEWIHDFMAFYNWAMNNGYNDTLTIDRMDVNGDYTPSNCRWANAKQQMRNTTRNVCYTINGETHCLSEWCEICNLNYQTVHSRIHKLGWSTIEALGFKERSCIH